MSQSILPGAWDPSIRIEPPAILPADKKSKQKKPEKFEEVSGKLG